jgi:outer membrane protein assembly factor BamB
VKSVWAGAAAAALAAMAQGDEWGEVAPSAGWDNLPPAQWDAGDWPRWRGPGLDNVAPAGRSPPTAWGPGSNVLWQARLPGTGHSSPCVAGSRLYLTSGDPRQGAVWLFALERDTGRVAWQAEIHKGAAPKQHADNSLASATPAWDGERVFVPYQTDRAVGVAAVGPDGQVVWRAAAAPYTSIQGYSASPALYKSAVILPAEGAQGSWLVALHRATGEVVWRAKIRTVKESYASPLVARVAGRDQLLLIGGESTRGYDPENGRLLWECDGPSTFCGATPAVGGGIVYATAGWPKRALLAIRADGAGDVSASHVVWRSDAKAGYIPSPLLHEGLLYAVNDQGLMRCYDAACGAVLWERDFKAPVYSSPLLAGGMIYVFDRKGKGFVMKAGRSAEPVSVNALPSGVFATPVVLDGRLYLRTLGDLYCIGE